MNRKIFLMMAVLLISGTAFAESDWEYWSSYELKAKISERIDFKFKPEFKYKEDMSRYYATETDIGFDWRASEQWILGFYYDHIYELRGGEWDFEHRPYLAAEYLWKWGMLSFGNRGRLEFRYPEGLDNSVRYRNRFTVKTPTVSKWKIQPYAYVEPYYDVDHEDWNRVRLAGGISWGWTKNLKSELYLMNEQNEGKSEWHGKNVLGSAIKLNF